MKYLLAVVLTGMWANALAQTPSTDEVAVPCIPAGASTQDSAGNTGPGEDDSAQGGVPCEELIPADASAEMMGGAEEALEEDPAIRASAEEEFTPGDEISEDYPVPLPADI